MAANRVRIETEPTLGCIRSWRPDEDSWFGYYDAVVASTWAEKLANFKLWLDRMATEVGPDPWSTLGEESFFRSASDERENTPFTPDEQVAIQRQLAEAKRFLRATQGDDLSEEQLAAMEATLEYLTGAVERLGRVDWKNNAIGALMAVSAEHAIPRGAVRTVLTLLGQTLGHMLGLPPVP